MNLTARQRELMVSALAHKAGQVYFTDRKLCEEIQTVINIVINSAPQHDSEEFSNEM